MGDHRGGKDGSNTRFLKVASDSRSGYTGLVFVYVSVCGSVGGCVYIYGSCTHASVRNKMCVRATMYLLVRVEKEICRQATESSELAIPHAAFRDFNKSRRFRV